MPLNRNECEQPASLGKPRSAIRRVWQLAIVTFPACLPLRADPIDIGSRLELFADRQLIERLSGVELRLHSPQPMPLARSPIRGAYMTVIKDGALYRAYYRGKDPAYTGPRGDGNAGEITCYAESDDGHEWRLPSLGLYEVNGSRDNNVILAHTSPFSHNFSPFLDTRPGVPSEERYKALAGSRAGVVANVAPGVVGGLHAFFSGDGIRWRRKGRHPVIPHRQVTPAGETRFDSQNVAFWSSAEKLYVCYFRTLDTPHGQLRTISRTTSPDFATWSMPVPMLPNLRGEHLYTSQTHPYFRAPHVYISLPTRFQQERGNSTDILFMTSKAGSTSYDRLFTDAFIRPGLDPERWNNRANYAALNVVPTGPAEMSIYNGPSGHRYVLRTDGFVSARTGTAEGELLTRPLVFSGRELVLNYSTSAGGRLRVEIQDEKGEAVAGARLQDCVELVGDEIERIVRWKAEPDLAALAGRPLRLRFVMQECDLYSFRFR